MKHEVEGSFEGILCNLLVFVVEKSEAQKGKLSPLSRDLNADLLVACH